MKNKILRLVLLCSAVSIWAGENKIVDITSNNKLEFLNTNNEIKQKYLNHISKEGCEYTLTPDDIFVYEDPTVSIISNSKYFIVKDKEGNILPRYLLVDNNNKFRGSMSFEIGICYKQFLKDGEIGGNVINALKENYGISFNEHNRVFSLSYIWNKNHNVIEKQLKVEDKISHCSYIFKINSFSFKNYSPYVAINIETKEVEKIFFKDEFEKMLTNSSINNNNHLNISRAVILFNILAIFVGLYIGTDCTRKCT